MTDAPARRNLPKPLRILRSRPRLFIAIVLGVAVGLFLPGDWRAVTRGLIGWNATIWFYLVAAGVMILRSEHRDIHRRALFQDEGRNAILAMTAIASTVSFGAIFAQLATVKDLPAAARGLHIGLALATIIGSWLFVHMIFALHYAHEFFRVSKCDVGRQMAGRH